MGGGSYLPGAARPAAAGARVGGRLMNRPDTIVLVVDDEPLVLFMVESALRLRGFRVLTAASGAAALELCALHGAEIGAALVDVTLRAEDGRQVLADLRAALPGLQVALMTG